MVMICQSVHELCLTKRTDTQTDRHPHKRTKLSILASNKHTGWKHYHLAIAGDKYAVFWDLCYWRRGVGVLFASLYRLKPAAILLDVRSWNIRNPTPSSNMQHSYGHTCICRVPALVNVTIHTHTHTYIYIYIYINIYILHAGAPFTNMD